MAEHVSTDRVAGPSALVRRLRTAGWFIARNREASTIVVAILLALYFYSTAPGFATSSNLVNISQEIARIGIVACGLALVLICAEIDLSVGQTFAFAPIIMWLAMSHGVPLIPAIVIGLAATAVVGFVNGFVTVYLRVHSFLTTLGMYFLINGLNVTITNGFPKDTPGPNIVTNGMGGSSYSEFIWLVALVVLLHLVLRRTRWGIHTLATGGNLTGAREAGVRTDVVKIGNFMACATLAGLTGILEAFRVGSIDPLAGSATVMFLGVSAAVIGGTSLLGGVGTMIGAFFGAGILTLLDNGFTLKGISAFTFDIILGIAILIAVALNVYIARFRTMRKPQ